MHDEWYKRGVKLLVGALGLVLLVVSWGFALQKPVSIAVDGKVITDQVFFSRTVAQVLDKNDIVLGEHDLIRPELSYTVQKNTDINIIRAVKVFIIADGQKTEVITPPVTVKEAVAKAGFSLGEKDIIKTTAAELIEPDQEIEIIRVKEEEIIEEAVLPYGEERTTDDTLEKGLSKTLRRGENGAVLNTVRITFHNGEEAKREIIDSEIKVEPVNRIVAMGNITTVSRGNLRLDFKEALYVQASAYTYTGRNTATGLAPEVGMVAVDPQVIPMGSALYIDGYGYAKACDTGGAVRGNRVDLFMEDRSQCLRWGVRNVKLYLLE